MKRLTQVLMAGASLAGWWMLCAAGGHDWGSSYFVEDERWDDRKITMRAITRQRCRRCGVWQ